MGTIHITYKRTRLCREAGFRGEVDVFEDGKRLEETFLTNESKEQIVKQHQQVGREVFLNGVLQK